MLIEFPRAGFELLTKVGWDIVNRTEPCGSDTNRFFSALGRKFCYQSVVHNATVAGAEGRFTVSEGEYTSHSTTLMWIYFQKYIRSDTPVICDDPAYIRFEISRTREDAYIELLDGEQHYSLTEEQYFQHSTVQEINFSFDDIKYCSHNKHIPEGCSVFLLLKKTALNSQELSDILLKSAELYLQDLKEQGYDV